MSGLPCHNSFRHRYSLRRLGDRRSRAFGREALTRCAAFLAMTALAAGGAAPSALFAQSAGDNFTVRLQLLPQPELGGGVPPEPVLPPLTIGEVRIFGVEATRATSSVRLSFETEPQTRATVRWGLTDAFEEGEAHSPGWERKHTFVIDDLEPATTYAFLIEVRDGYGRTASYRGKFSTRKEGEIAELPLPTPQAFQAQTFARQAARAAFVAVNG
ncbi:MAG: hypothetical protein KatS3mg099_321 [Candidatus Parcubacteria bacterium]|nr:MAG: hypothetical protein KatS3mg099_321 [Candidatus Parcubacteria bacterium]